MALLEKLGLERRKVRPVGQRLEKGREDHRRTRWKNIAAKVGIFAVLILLTLAAYPWGELFQYTVQVGSRWQRETLVAPFDYAIEKDPEAIEEERRNVRNSTPPYFREVPDAQKQLAANRDTVAQQLERVFEAYGSYVRNRMRGRNAEARADSLRYHELRRMARLKATPAQWQRLVNDYVEGQPGLLSTSRVPRLGPRLDQVLLQDAWQLGTQLINIGVLDVHLDSIRTDQIIIRNEQDNTQRQQSKNKENLFGLNEAYNYAQEQFREKYGNQEQASLANAFFRAIFLPSLNYLRADTVQEWRRRERNVKLTQGVVHKDEVIVRQGQPVTEEAKRKLQSLEREQRFASSDAFPWRVGLGYFMMILATYVIFFLYLFLLRRQIFDDNRKVLLIALLFAGIIGLYALAIRLPSLAMYAVPVVIASVLLTVMFDSRVGIFGTITLALIGGHLLGYDFEFAFATIFAGTLGVFSVRDIKNRGQFFLSAAFAFLGYVAVLTASWLIQNAQTQRFIEDVFLVAINSFLLIVAYPLLWVFERAFDVTTDLTLLELSDTNRPLLKELSLRAPGTFNHSLQVANLAEAAADAVGANALLTRVGALYHDIGKMLKPEYFVENQRPGQNPHEQLKPRMSALIIASHVKEGLELGRQYNLPQRVLKFIPMHHGTTRIEYFFRKAEEQRQPDDPAVQEAEFRYPGPRPDAKETGILMLTDSVEAASRSLSEPTHKRLETLIDTIFEARIEDGQLDYTDLTFRDLTQIKETFLSMLMGIYHVRVKYPGQEEEKERERSEPPPRDAGTVAPETAASEEEALGDFSVPVAGAPSASDRLPIESIERRSGEGEDAAGADGEEAARPAPPQAETHEANGRQESEAVKGTESGNGLASGDEKERQQP